MAPSPELALPRSFYARGALEVAPELLGAKLYRRVGDQVLGGTICETEAYLGSRDDASHAYRGPTARTQVMFGEPGHVYVYLIYGMWNCMNVVTAEAGVAEAVLVRGIRPLLGVERMQENRGGKKAIADGPGKLCQALEITRDQNGSGLWGPSLWIEPADTTVTYETTPRIGIDYAELHREELWRFVAE